MTAECKSKSLPPSDTIVISQNILPSPPLTAGQVLEDKLFIYNNNLCTETTPYLDPKPRSSPTHGCHNNSLKIILSPQEIIIGETKDSDTTIYCVPSRIQIQNPSYLMHMNDANWIRSVYFALIERLVCCLLWLIKAWHLCIDSFSFFF